MKISTKSTEVLRLPANPRECMLQVSASKLWQLENFKYLGVVGSLFTSEGRWGEEIDTRIGKANAILRELDRSVATKREISNAAQLSFFHRSLFRSLPKEY